MIIVEGPDGSGKTTLCKMLTGAFDLSYIKNPGVIKNKESITERLHWYHYLYSQKNVILDRFYPISEAIYGPLFRNECMISDYDIGEELRKFFTFDKNNILIIMQQKFKHEEHLSAEKSIHLSQNEKEDLEKLATKKQDGIFKMYNNFSKENLDNSIFGLQIIDVFTIEDYIYIMNRVKESIA